MYLVLCKIVQFLWVVLTFNRFNNAFASGVIDVNWLDAILCEMSLENLPSKLSPLLKIEVY